ncbi:uncharacterized protein LOC131858970 [Cryptomeria japonica]|uniref:uncharacterized protein LOC131858970 n=1 Tax=Cryptomeria japonica TaxID=3369 RepID=UPI0027DA8D90|nr:uncharacterized protein LOC131858970 [Cryptomeria japonica]
MKTLLWNVRGCNAPDKIRLIKRCLDQVRPDILLLQETKIKEEDFSLFSRKFQSWNCSQVRAQGTSGGLAILWKGSAIVVIIVRATCLWQWLKVISMQLQTSFFLFNIYGPTNSNLKKQLWSELSDILTNDKENVFILGGDFNALIRPSDKKGGMGWNRQSQRDFSSFVTSSSLIEIPFKMGEFTWTNRRSIFLNIAEKLDRFFITGDWLESHWTSDAEILPFTGSDHYPICLRVQDDSAPERCPFKFEAMWLQDGNIKNLIGQWWQHKLENPGNKAFTFFKKIQFVKDQLKQWNRVTFRNIFKDKLILEKDLKSLHEQIINNGMDEDLYKQEKSLNNQYAEVLAREETFWRQKSRENRLKEGDRNTKFFHTSVKVKRAHNKIFSIKNQGGNTLTDQKQINQAAIDHFFEIFNRVDNQEGHMPHIIEVIPPCIMEDHNKRLMEMVSLEEVKKVVFSLGADKSPRSDGFPALFFQKFWDILAEDIHGVVEESRRGGLPALRELDDFTEAKEVLVQLWGDKVKDYMQSSTGDLGKEWYWKDLSSTGLSAQEQQRLSIVLNQRKVFLIGKEDKVIWCGAKDGKYSVKLGYQLIEGREEAPSKTWPLFWSKECLPKAGAFAWLATKGRILTGERRKRLDLEGPSKCVMCNQAKESVDHLLLTCEVAQKCWSELQKNLNWQGLLQCSIREVFESWPKHTRKSTL